MITFLISDLAVKGGTHKQLLKLIDFVSESNLEFNIITKVIDFEKTYPGFRKYSTKIFEMKERKCFWIWAKITCYFKYLKDIEHLIKNSDFINIHDGGFEKYIIAFKNKKVYWQINDLHDCFNEGIASNKSHRLINKLKRYFILRNKDIISEVIVNVSKNAERVQKHFNLDAKVFYCGIDPLMFRKNNELTFKRFTKRKINLLSSGVFYPYRNYETQIKVIEILKERGVDAKLNIFGSTSKDIGYFQKINSLISEKNLQENINIHGQIDEDKFQELHRNSDLFIFINVDQSWGLSVFEAMSCGIPVIVSKSVGATEILNNNKNSLWVDPYNEFEIVKKILFLMGDYNKYNEISDESYHFVKKYNWNDTYCSKMVNLFKNN